jgi:hypothetical protein
MTLNDNNSRTLQEIDKSKLLAGNAINNATKWLTNTGGYVIANKNPDGTWESLVFADHADPAEWQNLIKINNYGVGFSTDGGTTYTQAWTIDGNLIADFIHGGTLTLGGDNNVNGWLRILNASGQQIGKWDKDGADITGKLTAKDSHGTAKIENGVIVLNADTGRSMLSMTRGDYYLSLSATDAFFEDSNSHFSVQSTWDNIIAVAKYFDDHGGWA